MRSFIAKRFQQPADGLTLDTEALAKYDDIIDLSIGDPDLTTDEAIIECAMSDAKAGYTRYGDPKGDPELVNAICQAWQEDYGQVIAPEQVLITTSSCMGMYMALTTVLDPDDEVIVFSPYFALYRQQIQQAGGVCVEVATYFEEGFSIDKDRLVAAITPKTKAIIFNNPANPTGKCYNERDHILIAQVAEEYDLLVLADEIYTQYLPDGSFSPLRKLPGMDKRTVTLHSFSKNYLMTGWRIGYIVAEPELIDTMNYNNGAMVYAAPSVSQRAALWALRRRQANPYPAIYLERLRYAAERIGRIPALELLPAQGTFYLFPRVRGDLTSPEICKLLLEQAHILVTPGHIFGSTGQGHFRIACTVSMDKLKEAFDRIEKITFEK